jgi:hypothetical protein
MRPPCFRFGILLIPLFLLACTAPGPPPLTIADLRAQLASLPGAEIGTGPELTLSYPGEALFASGAALPFPGGTELLNPLTEVMTTFPAVRWTGTVRAHGGVSPKDDQALAEKRTELLQRFFARRGIAGERLLLTATAADGAPLQLTAELPQAAPSGGK